MLLSLGRKRLAEARKAASAHRAQMARRGLLALERQADQLRAKHQLDDNQQGNDGGGSGGGGGGTGGGIGSPSAALKDPSSSQSPASKLSERIRSDVFGLKRAIRQSFRESRRYSTVQYHFTTNFIIKV